MSKLAFAFLFLFAVHSHAAELYSFIQKDCSVISGIPIGYSSAGLEILTTQGESAHVSAAETNSVVIYNTPASPALAIRFDETLIRHLKAIYLDDGDKEPSLAWPVRVIEESVVFFDINGNTHVHELAQILRLRPVTTIKLTDVKKLNGQALSLYLDNQSSDCIQKPIPGTSRPSRIIRDQIQIQEHFEELREGYEKIESFQERTYLYAKPLLYPTTSRLGASGVNTSVERQDYVMPLYFQWSGGEPYRFQSSAVVGGKTNPYTANFEPNTIFQSEVKSHLFHGILVANLAGAAAGKSVFTKLYHNKLENSQFGIYPSFNYMGLVGIDYSHYSFSAGYFYPSFTIESGDELREVLATKASYVAHFMYTTKKFRFRALGTTNDIGKSNPDDEDIYAVGKSLGPVTLPNKYSFKYIFARAGVDYDWTDELSTSLDYGYLDGKYTDITSGANQSAEFTHHILSAIGKLQFGSYTALSYRMNYYLTDDEFHFAAKSGDRKKNLMSSIWEFEFVF